MYGMTALPHRIQLVGQLLVAVLFSRGSERVVSSVDEVADGRSLLNMFSLFAMHYFVFRTVDKKVQLKPGEAMRIEVRLDRSG